MGPIVFGAPVLARLELERGLAVGGHHEIGGKFAARPLRDEAGQQIGLLLRRASFVHLRAVDVLHQDFLADLHLAGRRIAEGVLARERHHRLENASAANRTGGDRFLRVDVELRAVGVHRRVVEDKLGLVLVVQFQRGGNGPAQPAAESLQRPDQSLLQQFFRLERLEQTARHDLAQLRPSRPRSGNGATSRPSAGRSAH